MARDKCGIVVWLKLSNRYGRWVAGRSAFVFFALLLAAIASPAQGEDIALPAEIVASREPPVPAGRLSDAAAPQAYRLDLTLDPARERFSGRAEIDVVLAEPAAHIDLHGRDLAVRRVSASVGETIVEGRWEQVDSSGVVRLRFDQVLPAGPIVLAFEYNAAFNDSPAGLFRVNVDGEWYGWSQFQAIDARAAFPSFDQPSFKTPFTITLRTPAKMMAISNAPERSRIVEDGMAVHRFVPTLPLPTYLVAMMVGPFVALESTVPPTQQRSEPLPLRIVSTQPNAAQLGFALQGSKQIVRLLENYFDGPFPYPKLDQITSPVMGGAMENAGANLYRDGLLVLDETSPIPQQRRFGMVVAHELAHQWFGDLVTPEWWDDIWLNESFANWMGYRFGDAWRPDLNIRAGALAEGFRAMQTDALLTGRPIRQPIDTNVQIDAAFDSITYGKGGHVVAMIAAFMGEGSFREGVRRFIAAHRHGTATSADFFEALANAAGDPRIVPAMKSFVEQQGVPLLLVRRDGNRYTVGQQRYAPLGVTAPETQWGVPFCVRQGNERHCQLLTERSATFTIAGSGPLVPNAGGTGYYRFELTKRHWNALISGARSLSGGEAQAVADSLGASVLAGRGNVAELARLTRELVHHPDTYAADAAANVMSDLVRSGIIDAAGKRGWRQFRARLYSPLLKEYGFDPRAGAYADEPPDRSQRRVQIVEKLVGTARAGNLRRQLVAAAEVYLAGDDTALDAAWFSPAFDFQVFAGGDEAARELVERALSSEDPVFRPAALDAAARSGSSAIAHWMLEELDDARLRASERLGLLDGIMSHPSTRDYGYGWMLKNLDSLVSDNIGIFAAADLPKLLSGFCSVEQARNFAQDLRPRFAGTRGELELERVIEQVRNCGMLDDERGFELSKGFAKLK